MNWIMYLTWLAGPVLQITLLIFMVRRNYHTVFPRFFSYILFQTVKSACLFVAYRYFVDSYFDAYWTGNALSLIFTVVVMDEILRNLFHEYGAAQVLSTTIFRWSCVLLLLLAILGAMSSGNGAADTLAAVVLSFDRSMRVMQVGLFLLLMILCRLLTNSWRQQGFGIAAVNIGDNRTNKAINLPVAIRKVDAYPLGWLPTHGIEHVSRQSRC